MKTKYKCLSIQEFNANEFSLVPIRFNDRFKIMQWRNEQIYHLRQSKTLTKQEQDRYFNTVVSSLFDDDKPEGQEIPSSEKKYSRRELLKLSFVKII